MICDKCGSNKNVQLVPTIGQLIFGGFPVRHEYRCHKCELAASKTISKLLKEQR